MAEHAAARRCLRDRQTRWPCLGKVGHSQSAEERGTQKLRGLLQPELCLDVHSAEATTQPERRTWTPARPAPVLRIHRVVHQQEVQRRARAARNRTDPVRRLHGSPQNIAQRLTCSSCLHNAQGFRYPAVTMRCPRLDNAGPTPDMSRPGACTRARQPESSGWSLRRGD